MPVTDDELLPFDPARADIIIRRVPAERTLQERTPEQSLDNSPRMKVVTNVPCTVVHHSPTGYEFGFGGSGPADLALNILNLFVPPEADGLRPVKCYRHTASRTAWQLHQSFKWKFIGPLPEEGGVLPGTLIRAWIAEQQPAILECYAPLDQELEQLEQLDELEALEEKEAQEPEK